MNFKRILGLVMALIMMASVCAPAISAIAVIEDDWTVAEEKLKEIEEIKETIEETAERIVTDIADNHEKYYADGYAYLSENGYISAAIEAVGNALTVLDEINLDGVEMTDDLRTKLNAEIDALKSTLEKLEAVLKNEEASDFDSFVNTLLKFESDLYVHLDNIYAILEQAGIDVNEFIIVPALDDIIRILNDEVIPAIKELAEEFINAVSAYVYEALAPYYDEILNTINIALDTYEMLVKVLTKYYLIALDAYNTAVDVYNKIVEEVTELVVAFVEIYERVEYALNVVDSAIRATVDFCNKVIGDVESFVDRVETFITNAIRVYRYTVNLLVDVYESIGKAIMTTEEIYDYCVKFWAENGDLIEEGLAQGVNIALEICGDIVDIIKEAYGAKDDAYIVASKISAYIAKLLKNVDDAINDKLDGAVNGNYELKDESFYLSLGNLACTQQLAQMLHLGNKYQQLGIKDNYLDALAGADLVTVKLDNGSFVELINMQVLGALAEIIRENQDIMAWYNRIDTIDGLFNTDIKETVDGIIDINAKTVDLDWSLYLNEEEQVKLNNVLAAIKVEFIERGVPEYYEYDINPMIQEIVNENGLGGILKWNLDPLVIPVADLFVFVVENALYGYAEFTANVAEIIDNVNKLSPNATVVLTGVGNPFTEMEIFGISLDEYAEYVDGVVDGLNAQLYLTALACDNVIFVENADADTIYDALNVFCNHVYDNCVDVDCNRCFDERVVPGHTFTNYVFNNDSTCTKDGTETAKCDFCDAEDKRTAKDSKAEHDWKAATCKTPMTCKNCNATQGEKADHVMGDWRVAKDPTTSEEGLREQQCLHCDYIITETIPNEKLETGAIIAIIVACVAVLAGASAGLAAWRRKKS